MDRTFPRRLFSTYAALADKSSLFLYVLSSSLLVDKKRLGHSVSLCGGGLYNKFALPPFLARMYWDN